MPSRAAHLKMAEHNQTTLDYLIEKLDTHPDWVVTVAFYKAVHLAEALLAAADADAHSHDHRSREFALKNNPSYANAYKHYRPLRDASFLARYFACRDDGEEDFSSTHTTENVKEELIGHRLCQFEKSVRKHLNAMDAKS